MWSAEDIADAALAALRQRDRELREEHAVYGLDSCEEVELHPLIARGLQDAGFGVVREQPYPHEWFRKLRPSTRSSELALPLPRDRQRCDLVLTPSPGEKLDDSLLSEKARRAEAREIEGTLFEFATTSHLTPGSSAFTADAPHRPSGVPPERAFWLEVKLVAQFCPTDGVPGPNRTYTGEITRNPIADLSKLAGDAHIHHAGLLLIVFTVDEAVARHDLAILAHKLLDRELPITSPVMRSFPITDRIGNTLCTLCLIPVRND
jgi:hypothetical protein